MSARMTADPKVAAPDAANTETYLAHRRRNYWRENTLAQADEDTEGNFSWKLLSQFTPYTAKYKGVVILSIVLMLVYTALNVANPYLIGVVIDQFIGAKNLSGMAIIGIVLLVLNVLMWLAQYFQVWTMSWAGEQMLYQLSADMFAHLQRLALSFYDRTQIGRVMSRLQSDIDVLDTMISSGLLSILGSLVALIGIVGVMIAMHAGLALLTLAVIPLMAIIAFVWQKYATRSFRLTRAAISLVNATLQENISGMRVIQSLAREDRNRGEFDELNAYNRDMNYDASKVAALVLPLVEIVAALATALILVYGGVLVSRGTIQVGVLVAFTLYINRFFDPIRDLSQQYTQLQRAGVAAERIFQIMNVPVEIQDRPDAYPMPEVQGDVDFDHVVFGYKTSAPVLHGLDLHIPAGQTVAIVGPTGAGKSTIIGLLTRFYDVLEGAIRIDGIDIRDVTLASLRRQIGVVPQDPFLFTGTIRENIRYGRLDASDAEVEAAAQTIGAHDLIMRLPQGYATPIRERGRNLSVGQRQMISFARALLADPHILILDEATANIDTFTELVVQDGLDRLLKGRTAVIIAHRLSTIKNAHRIVVLDQGEIVEQGSHAELLAEGGFYANLYAMGFRHTA